ncbi:MAG: hypothetical protein RI897_3591 [Verrucomicrobiota bacterium]
MDANVDGAGTWQGEKIGLEGGAETLKHRVGVCGADGGGLPTPDSRLPDRGGVRGEIFGVFAQEVQGGSVYVSVC